MPTGTRGFFWIILGQSHTLSPTYLKGLLGRQNGGQEIDLNCFGPLLGKNKYCLLHRSTYSAAFQTYHLLFIASLYFKNFRLEGHFLPRETRRDFLSPLLKSFIPCPQSLRVAHSQSTLLGNMLLPRPNFTILQHFKLFFFKSPLCDTQSYRSTLLVIYDFKRLIWHFTDTKKKGKKTLSGQTDPV